MSFVLSAAGGCVVDNPDWEPRMPDAAVDGGPRQPPAAADGSLGGDQAAPDGAIADVVDVAARDRDAEETPEDLAAADAGSPDLSVSGDAAVDVAPMRPMQSAALPEETCGTVHADVSGIVRADGVVVDRDGTLYFTVDDGTHGYIGRLQDGTTLDARWLRLVNAPVHTGIALDGLRRKLYIALKTSAAILVFDLATEPPEGSVYTNLADDVNDLAIAPDGTLFVSLQDRQSVYFVRDGAVALLSKAAIGQASSGQGPAGLAWSPDGDLLVGISNGGGLLRIELQSSYVESSRARFGGNVGWPNGIAFDESGRSYLGIWSSSGAGKVVRLDADGSNPSDRATNGNFASLAFGRGILDCTDLYVANPAGPMRRISTDSRGLRQP